MREIIKFLERYHFFIIFVILEIFSINLLIKHNYFQQSQFLKITTSFQKSIYSSFESISNYSKLREENRILIEENNKLYNLLRKSYNIEDFDTANINKIVERYEKLYFFKNAHVINMSTNKKYNYITLDKGKKDGVEKEMAVICGDGIVGIIKDVSNNLSIVLPVININFQVSAKIKRNNYFGILQWNGENYRKAILNDIPLHVQIYKGDTVVTSGYSYIFPEGIMIGTIKDFTTKEGNYYKIIVELSTDFKKIRDVQIIKYLYKNEQEELEKQETND